MTDPDQIEGLLEALALSPDNVPLRLHIAEELLRIGRAENAEREFREVASRERSTRVLLGLARAFEAQGKTSQALVVVEDLVAAEDASGQVRVLYARLLLEAGEPEAARAQYRAAVLADSQSADPALADRLSIAGFEEMEAREDEVAEAESLPLQRATWESDADGAELDDLVERPEICFEDVGGMEQVKEEIQMKIVLPLRDPELFRAYGKSIGGGILLYGPPGCGKTYLARAAAGEVEASFISVGLSDVLDMWIGNSERNLHEIFERARRSRPCVLFFDEVDALGARRSDMLTSGIRQVINQFLAELDGVASDNAGVLVLAATNAPWHVDTAFRRPGRFDRVILVPPPDEPARVAILRIHLRDKPVDDVDVHAIARKTDWFSGADLRALVDVAVEAKLREALRAGVPRPLTTKDLLAAARSATPSTREWFATARNYVLYANQSGQYNDLLPWVDRT